MKFWSFWLFTGGSVLLVLGIVAFGLVIPWMRERRQGGDEPFDAASVMISLASITVSLATVCIAAASH